MPTREAAVATLGIAEDADKGAATKAYRKLAMRWHPGTPARCSFPSARLN